jgi:hypothetical protein
MDYIKLAIKKFIGHNFNLCNLKMDYFLVERDEGRRHNRQEDGYYEAGGLGQDE